MKARLAAVAAVAALCLAAGLPAVAHASAGQPGPGLHYQSAARPGGQPGLHYES